MWLELLGMILYNVHVFMYFCTLGTMPTLMRLLAALVTDAEKSKPFLCTVACMLLKQKSQRMSLVQRIISLLLYGNGTRKKVCAWLYKVYEI